MGNIKYAKDDVSMVRKNSKIKKEKKDKTRAKTAVAKLFCVRRRRNHFFNKRN